MNRLLNISLALLVFACPLWCVFAKCSTCEVIAATAPSCCCCPDSSDFANIPSDQNSLDQDPSDQDPASPSKPTSPKKHTQCFCGGAVLVDLSEFDWDVWAGILETIEISSDPILEYSEEIQFVEADAPRSCSGRMLRQLLESWTL